MPLVKQTGVIGARRNLNILCDVFLLSSLLMGVLLTAPGCCAKIETQIKLLNDDYTMPTRMGNDASSSSSSSSPSLDTTVPHYTLYKNDLKRISYETIHRILRDENEPMIYRANDLRYFHKRSSTTEHEISKRSVVESLPSSAGIRLNLTGSNLESFPMNATHSLEDITSIILHNNSLREFPLSAVPNLTMLDLSDNNFTYFEVPVENTQLRVLNLNQNHIVNFTANSTSNNLRELHIKDNAMLWLGQLNLSLLDELEILDLSCNQLENLETAFFPTRMKNLKYLNLARNRLQCIYRETFYNLLSMNTLILSYNEIAEIDYETFLALPNLQYLDLSHNLLRGDSIRALQGIPDLVGLSIAYNWQLGDSMQEFVASWSLKELDASGTGLCKIPAALAQSVRTLKLADNWLTIINCGDLDSYPLLQYLDLSHSHIDEIEEDALGRLEILETLFLDHNNLKRIPISLPTSLEHLFLQDNQIMDIQPQTFQGLNNLKTLDLSANKLLYLPDLPLPKLITLNLQSSGISGLHQAIVQTSPHLRDLYLEDNPIKCADLLGIAEWASPCRNDRRIAERINIKSHYVQMHNYFERFQCGGNADTCATCTADDVSQIVMPKGNTYKRNCVEVNGLGKLATTKPTPQVLSQEKKNNEEPKQHTTITTTTAIPLTRKTYAESTTSPATDANQDEPKGTYPTPDAAQPEVYTTTTTSSTPSSIRIQTNSTDKISPSPQQKQLADTSPSPAAPSIRRPSQIKSDNNYVETSAGSSSPSTTTPPPPPASLLSQENTGKSHKGLKAQSDNATKIGHSINGEISVPTTTAAKSNLPTMTQLLLHSTTPTTITSTTKTTTTLPVRHTPTEKGSIGVQQHNRIQEILHTKDRHLIGTPLLMHKGHVVLVPPTAASVWTTTTTAASKENLLHLAPRQDGKIGSHSSTKITTSKGHKLEMVVDHHHQHHYQQQQQGSNENAIIKGAKKKNNGPLGQDNHYQDIQQTQQQYKLHNNSPLKVLQQKQQNIRMADKKDTTAQQKFQETSSPAKDKNQRYSNNDNKRRNTVEQDKQFASNFEVTTKSEQHHSSHSLNTPLDGRISHRWEKDESSTEFAALSTTPVHHSRVNTALLKNDDDSQNLNANVAPSNSQHSTMQSTIEGQTINRSNGGSSAALIKVETGPESHQTERWLDIRKATRHPGLVVVIGVTIAMVFILGLVQVYRYRQKPLNYIGHRRHCAHATHEHHQHQYQQQDDDYADHQRHHHHHYQHHPLHQHHLNQGSTSNTTQPDNDHRGEGNNHNQCNDERMQPPLYSSPHHLLRIHEKPPSSSAASSYEIQRDKFTSASLSSGYATNRSTTTTTTTPTSNYRLFQLNGRRIKHNHHSSSSSPSKDDENDFYTEMNHGPQSVLASDFFPMELLSAPSRIPQSSVPVPSSHTHPPSTSVSLVSGSGHQSRTIDDEFQDTNRTTAIKERSKFEIW